MTEKVLKDWLQQRNFVICRLLELVIFVSIQGNILRCKNILYRINTKMGEKIVSKTVKSEKNNL